MNKNKEIKLLEAMKKRGVSKKREIQINEKIRCIKEGYGKITDHFKDRREFCISEMKRGGLI